MRFACEFVLAFAALGAGLGCLWAVARLARPVLEFFIGVGL